MLDLKQCFINNGISIFYSILYYMYLFEQISLIVCKIMMIFQVLTSLCSTCWRTPFYIYLANTNEITLHINIYTTIIYLFSKQHNFKYTFVYVCFLLCDFCLHTESSCQRNVIKASAHTIRAPSHTSCFLFSIIPKPSTLLKGSSYATYIYIFE